MVFRHRFARDGSVAQAADLFCIDPVLAAQEKTKASSADALEATKPIRNASK